MPPNCQEVLKKLLQSKDDTDGGEAWTRPFKSVFQEQRIKTSQLHPKKESNKARQRLIAVLVRECENEERLREKEEIEKIFRDES